MDELWVLLELAGTQKRSEEGILCESLSNILEILDEFGAKSTFFLVGKDIKKHKDCFKQIVENGHEIGNHTYSHNHNFARLTYKEKREEIQKTNKLIKKYLNIDTVGFRAPKYQIDRETFEILEDMHFSYDSSLIPSYHPKRYPIQWLFAPATPYYPSRNKIWKKSKIDHFNVLEIPISVNPFIRMPIGGTYILNLGFWWLQINSAILSRFREPMVINFHARDGVNYIPKIEALPGYIYKRKGESLSMLRNTFKYLLKYGSLVRMRDLASEYA